MSLRINNWAYYAATRHASLAHERVPRAITVRALFNKYGTMKVYTFQVALLIHLHYSDTPGEISAFIQPLHLDTNMIKAPKDHSFCRIRPSKATPYYVQVSCEL